MRILKCDKCKKEVHELNAYLSKKDGEFELCTKCSNELYKIINKFLKGEIND